MTTMGLNNQIIAPTAKLLSRVILTCALGILCLSGTAIAAANPLATEQPGVRDLASIVHSGKLRVLYLSRQPRALSISQTEKTMLERFARQYNLVLEWHGVQHQWDLLAKLASGRGDIIIGQGNKLAAGMTDIAAFTHPWISSYQQVVVRSDTSRIDSLDDLRFRQVALKRSSPMWHLMHELAGDNPTMGLVEIPEQLSLNEIMQRVANGQYDVTVADSEFLREYLPQHPELSSVYDLSAPEQKAWAVACNAVNMQDALNNFLNKNHLEFNLSQIYFDDLPKLKDRKVLRLITYQDPEHYFLDDGGLHGFEYELVRKFARSQNMRVDVVLANSHAEMEKMLMNGAGDVIAASLPINSITDNSVVFTSPYNYSSPIIVGRPGENPILDERGLNGRRITISAESPYLNLLEAIRARGVDMEIDIAPERYDARQIVSMIGRGMFDLTVVDSNKFDSDMLDKQGVIANFALSEPAAEGWAVRKNDEQLLTALNNYIGNIYRKGFYNTLYAKYIKNPGKYLDDDPGQFAVADKLSPYDDIVIKYADKYSFDWRLIVAQMYQESRFNPQAVSHAGAECLMQMLPTTAEEVGVSKLDNPSSCIKAGVRYLSQLRGQFEPDLLLEERTWFSLASYNAGYGSVQRARKQAAEMGLDPNRWFGNVELAMHARETVAYVQDIRTLYNNYVRLTQAGKVAEVAESDSSQQGI